MYRLTRKAVDDLVSIWNYTQLKWSEKQADKYYYLLIETFDTISKHPEMGKDYSHIKENLMGQWVGRHIVFYRITSPNEILIVRILHERMDFKSRFK